MKKLLLFLTALCFMNTSVASDLCRAIALKSVSSLENQDAILAKGEYAEAVSIYWVDKKNGNDGLCEHGGYCYPMHIKINGKRVEMLKLTNCKIGNKNSEDKENIFYNIDFDREKNSKDDIALSDISSKFLEFGLCRVCAENLAKFYIEHPLELCSKLAKKALAENAIAQDQLENNCYNNILLTDSKKKSINQFESGTFSGECINSETENLIENNSHEIEGVKKIISCNEATIKSIDSESVLISFFNTLDKNFLGFYGKIRDNYHLDLKTYKLNKNEVPIKIGTCDFYFKQKEKNVISCGATIQDGVYVNVFFKINSDDFDSKYDYSNQSINFYNEKKQEKYSSLEAPLKEGDATNLMQAIKQKVNLSWVSSPDSENLKCTVRVKLASDGTVLDVSIERSSGDEMFDRSAENAVNNASPLPVPQDKELFERAFKTVTFVFDPK